MQFTIRKNKQRITNDEPSFTERGCDFTISVSHVCDCDCDCDGGGGDDDDRRIHAPEHSVTD